jgi:hypothetical protein
VALDVEDEALRLEVAGIAEALSSVVSSTSARSASRISAWPHDQDHRCDRT